MAAWQCINCGQIEAGNDDCCAAPDLFKINDMPAEIKRLREYKTWYDEAMGASNAAGFVGVDAAQTIRDLDADVTRLRAIVDEVHSWAVCAAIASPEDMAQNFPHIVEITGPQQ